MKNIIARRICELDDNIAYWKSERAKMRFGGNISQYGQVIFCNDYSKVNGYYERTNIPARIAYKLVLKELNIYIQSLKNERKKIVNGGFINKYITLLRGYISN